MTQPEVVRLGHPSVRLVLLGLLDNAGQAALPTAYSHTEGRLPPYDLNAVPVQRGLWAAVTPLWPGWTLPSSTPTGPCRRWPWTRCPNTSTRHMTP